MTPGTRVSERIEAFNKSLLQDKVKLKYKLMAANAYRFYRGTCHLFYEDLSTQASFPSSPQTWICGDLHLENFGSYKANNRFVYFDQNDFGESILAPSAWELVRMITSIFVAFEKEENKVREWAELYLDTYCDTLTGGKEKHIEARLANGIVKSFLERISKRTSKQLLRKQVIKKKRRNYLFIDNRKYFSLEDSLKAELLDHLKKWISVKSRKLTEYEVEDVAFRVAGTGSLGVKRYVFLLHNLKRRNSFLLLDMKESRPSSLQKYVSIPQPVWASNAEREVAIQLRMQDAAVALTDTIQFRDDFFVIQELQPAEDKIDMTLLVDREKDIRCIIEDMAVLTASAQLRSSGRQGSAIADELIEFGKSRGWQSDILAYAKHYSKQVQTYYKEFSNDYNKGYFK